MKLIRIRQVKKQIRVLGLSARRAGGSFFIVGVVYRGRLSMDGVLSTVTDSPETTSASAGMITGSPHLNQIRVIAVDADRLPPGVTLDPHVLASRTGKPVLSLTRGPVEPDERFMFTWRGWTVTSVGLSRVDAEKVLEVCSFEGVPEALRVASLVAESVPVPGLHNV